MMLIQREFGPMQQPTSITLAEFLEWEKHQPGDERHEFLDGEIVAFGQGATLQHNELVSRLHDFVREHKAAGCFSVAGMQRLIAGENQTFPDIVLICDERDLHAEDNTTIRYPKLIVEVLSPATASKDLITKRRAYQKIETLEEYLVVESRERYALLYRRDGTELREVAQRSDGPLALASLGATLDLDALYAGILPK